MFLRKKKRSKPKKRGRSRKPRSGRADLWYLFFATTLVVVIAGIGLLKWSKSRSGQAALLSLGSEKMYSEVQNAVDGRLDAIFTDFTAGPTAATGSAFASDNSDNSSNFDWPATELGSGAAVRCRLVPVPAGSSYWEIQQDVAEAIASVGGKILWGERVLPERLSAAQQQPNELKDILRLDLGVTGKPTHTLLLYRQGTNPVIRWGQGPGQTAWSKLAAQIDQPTIALIIDDWGNSRTAATKSLLSVPAPMTLAVLPGLSYSRHFALQGTPLVLPADRASTLPVGDNRGTSGRPERLAAGCFVEVLVQRGQVRLKNKRREIILHLPMEPQSYPETNPGANALMVGMSTQQIKDILDKSLQPLPMVTGVNNHMGSAATSDQPTMAALMAELKDRQLFFIDSLTTARSVASGEAARAGIPTARNRIFLDYDNENHQQISRNLNRLVQAARSTGFVVGIGHPHPATAEVLAREIPRLQAEGVRFVTISELMALRDLATTQ